MTKIKKLLLRMPKLSRAEKITRNFVLLIVLCLAFWFLEGGSALTRESALREMERRLFLSPGETVFESESYGGGSYRDVFVLGRDYAYSAQTSRFSFLDIGVAIHETAVRKDGPVLLRADGYSEQMAEDTWRAMLFCPWCPEGTVRVKVDLSATYVKQTYSRIDIEGQWPPARGDVLSTERNEWTRTYEGKTDIKGFSLIEISGNGKEEARLLSLIWDGKRVDHEQTQIVEHIPENAGYRLEFYDENDILLQTATGELE